MSKIKTPHVLTRHAPGEKPKDLKKTLKRLVGYVLERKFHFVLLLLIVCIVGSAELAILGLQKPLINGCILPLMKQNHPDLTQFYHYIYCMIGLMLLGTILAWIQAKIRIQIVNRVFEKIRNEMFAKFERLPIIFFDKHQYGEIMSLFTNDVDTLLALHLFPRFCMAILTIVIIFTSMIVLSPVLTVFVSVVLCLIFLIIKLIMKQSRRFYQQQQESIGHVNGYIEEIISGAKVVKVFCREPAVEKEFDQKVDTLFKDASSAITCSTVLMPCVGNLSYFLIILTGIVGGFLLSIGKMDFGSLAVFIQFTRLLTRPIAELSTQCNEMLSALAGSERIFKFLDETDEIDNGYVRLVNVENDKSGNIVETEKLTNQWAWKHPHHDGTTTYTKLSGNVVFENVNFGYIPEKQVLFDFNLEAQAGTKVAFVGSTGAGKTTITNLINKFYLLHSGKIRYDGININKIKQADLRKSMAMVLQDTHLFTGSVMNNIKYGNLNATDDDVIHVAKMACADDFIQKLPKGYDTVLTADGGNLSQGQRQLLSIARAMLANPPVLILDEATSCVDTRTEALIEKAMNNLMKGRTVFVIAHRLSTVRNADKIVVIEQGKIIETGNHDELMALKNKYYDLYTGAYELS
ncbi:MAG: ABC transporter ATP-binding protein/permease [Alphaproteobacteria bacterium]|nr:ABC transporter ATP-binding protein/permease [Alphaproteobacteria bacterium]